MCQPYDRVPERERNFALKYYRVIISTPLFNRRRSAYRPRNVLYTWLANENPQQWT